MNWTLDDVRALSLDDYDAVIQMMNKAAKQ